MALHSRVIDGAELRAIRGRLGWSQRRMGAELGVSNAAICRWEAGNRGINPRTAAEIARIDFIVPASPYRPTHSTTGP